MAGEACLCSPPIKHFRSSAIASSQKLVHEKKSLTILQAGYRIDDHLPTQIHSLCSYIDLLTIKTLASFEDQVRCTARPRTQRGYWFTLLFTQNCL